MIESKNVFYVSNFNSIGGVETYIFELARKYKEHDITIVYKTGSLDQVKRIRDYVRIIRYNGEKIKCKKAFFNYETDIIDNIEADEYIQLIHAMFKTQKISWRIHPKITKFLAVSESAKKEWEELTKRETTVCRNPLEITEEERTPILYLMSATRLTREKGKERMKKLAEKFDEAGIKFLWLVFTNDEHAIDNPSIVYMKPRLDIRPFLASLKGRGYGVQVSDCEGDCYFTRECEALGVPLLVTPVPSFKEQGLVDGKNCYYIPFDVEKVNVKMIATKIPDYEPYKKYEDSWGKILAKGKSTYDKEKENEIHARVIKSFTLRAFNELKNLERADKNKNKERHLYEGDTFECDTSMFEYLTIIPNKDPLIERI